MVGLEEHGGWPTILGDLAAGSDLTREAAAAAMQTVLAGEASDAQLAAFIVALRMKGETTSELTGMVDAMLDAAEPLPLPEGCIDIVGTGGSQFRREHALSVSTMACFVAAGAGAKVCKHGNVRASATSGAFDTLEALGVAIGLDGAGVAQCVVEAGVGFAFARAFHPAMRHAGPVRSELGIPTVFNFLGPLANPGRVRRHLLGVSRPDMGPKAAGVLQARSSERALVVHGADGLDEISTTGPTTVWELADGEVTEWQLDPSEHGVATASLDDIAGGDAERNAEIAHGVFGGEGGPHSDIVVLNAGAALVVADVAGTLGEGIERARAAIADGGAAAALASVADLSHRLSA